MTEFDTRYAHLNARQKEAVDTLEGPVMVVAGPGTGKTELLSVRAANILRKTDVSPNNILCLTYTEAGATAMRERLAQLIGPDAYKVAVHTFHSFGAEIINRYAQYFYHGAHFRPADELSTYEVLSSLFDTLPNSSPLSGMMNGVYTHLSDTQSAISELKKSGLTPEETLTILDRNDAFTDWVRETLNQAFEPRLSKKRLEPLRAFCESIKDYREAPLELINYQPLASLMYDSLSAALDEAGNEDSTRPVSEWKRRWISKDDDGALNLKDALRCRKLRAVANLYYHYLRAMQERELFDFDDMILRVIHGLELFDDLRYELQEQYQYIMVDEFQDTNDGQMRLVWNLTNAPVLEGRPNLLAVGDDDQAIYRFQGANLSNILDFHRLYRDVHIIALTDNYRSDASILAAARDVIIQANERLETTLEDLDKSLTAHHAPDAPEVEYCHYDSISDEYAAIAEQLSASIAANPDKSRAVIARRHYQLQALLPYLQDKAVPIMYEREESILDQEPILLLELLARVVNLLAAQQQENAESHLPELLAHQAWGLQTTDLWQLSLYAKGHRTDWLTAMEAQGGQLKRIANWLIEGQRLALTQPVEYMLDWLFGAHESLGADTGEQDDNDQPFSDTGDVTVFVSPFKEYYFSTTKREQNAAAYLHFLNGLRALRQKMREYRPDVVLKLADFVTFLDLHRDLKLSIRGVERIGSSSSAVQLLTAHGSKGLEFDEVFIIGLSDTTWGETARSRAKLISFPHNLPLGFDADTTDERIRLLYVALTRAKEKLHLSAHLTLENGRAVLPVGYLSTGLVKPRHDSLEPTLPEQAAMAAAQWRATYTNLPIGTMEDMLRPVLERYRLSATHLTNFLDVTRGGPEQFLLHNLLRFPQAMSPSSAYGSAIHSVLQRAHTHLSATGNQRPVEDILTQFEEELRRCQLSELEFERFLQRGIDALQIFLTAKHAQFNENQLAEIDFGSDDIRLQDARITGKIDLMEIDKAARTITVTDYKTGKPTRDWRGRTEYEKIKLHHYRQQLLFYKLLIENSRAYAGYTVTRGFIQFVEPDRSGEIHRLELTYDEDSLKDFHDLVCAVWREIMSLRFAKPDVSENFSGIVSYENSLRA